MSEYIHLLGTEDVARAGRAMQSAADKMERAVSHFEFQLDRLERILQEFGESIPTSIQLEIPR